MFKPTTALWQIPVPQFFKLSFLSSTIAALALTTGCSSTTTTHPTKSKNMGSGDYLDASSLDSLEDLLSATDMSAVEGDRLLILKHGDVWKRMTVGFKMDEGRWDPRIEAQRNWFVSRQPYLDRLSARASRYLYHTVKEAERRGMPTELALLPVIESSYDPAATSSASAAGLWQFIPSTGRIYGLQQTGSYDARRDVVESTRAAYEFLGSLYNQFGSWELALAAYNAGPGRVQQAINRNAAAGLPTDYWSLKLPAETMNYVPRFLAVAQIVKNPRAYGVVLPPIANRPHFREVKVPAGASLSDIANLTGLSRTELYSLNPGYRGEIIDPASPARILVPSDVSPAIDKKLMALKSGYSGSTGGFWAGSRSVTPPKASTSVTTATRATSSGTVLTPSRTTPPPITATTSNSANVASVISRPSSNNVSTGAHKQTPQDANALAMFANNADVPSAPRIPVAVTTANTVKKPIAVEPPISLKERERIQAEIRSDDLKNETVKQVVDPVASSKEKQQVVNEIKAIAPAGTEIVDPYDGKIKLTAIQTSLSVAENEGKEVSKSFSYPKQLVESTPETSPDVQRNKDKNYIQTDTDVVVVAPKGQRSTYTVISGDTLAIIAMKNGVSWRDIAKWNQIDPNAPLYAGTTLYLYNAKPQSSNSSSSTTTKAAKPESYVVKANDSLTGVANQFGFTVKQLADWNNLTTTSNLFVGQKLSLKAPEVEKPTAENARSHTTTNATKAVKIKTKLYVVKRGEYLKMIADRYGLSNQELADLTSGLTPSSSLMAGQKIHVPLHEVTPETDASVASTQSNNVEKEQIKTERYKVQHGDSLSSIAAKAKMSLGDFAKLNNLSTNSSVRVGQTLKIPEGMTVPDVYTVKSGDHLSSIAAQYGLTVDYIAKLNGLSRTSGIRVGQHLKLTGDLPSDDSNSSSTDDAADATSYVVKPGDTLATVAKKYHLKTVYLAELNDLTASSRLRIGQSLKLKEDASAKTEVKAATNTAKAVVSTKDTETYVVQAGESLTSLANRYGLSVKALAEMNDLTPKSSLRRGQKISVPKQTTTYKVKSGDSLIRLAAKYDMDVKQLAEMNNLEPNSQLRLGTTLKVPNL
ncbi:LysM peptidoglycan-binding domain-containing protein [Acinetobacter sp.]|uniref:LysM peptidoglycan-binding domain-containing protein n=1 Tax=Acinetobacter sp. TaxID=472 RepID=UPI0031D1D77D